MSASSHYLHGTSPEEQHRLGLLNEILNEGSLRELALRGGERIVDFGSGLGQLTRAMARAAGVPCVAIERSREQLAEAARQARVAGEENLLDLRQGEVTEPPLREGEWGTFDVAHARFVLEHVPDPVVVVRAMVRAARPGRRIVIADDDHSVLRLWPEPPGFRQLWETYCRSFDRAGNDPFVGRRLVSLLHQAGANPVRNTWIFFGGCAGEARFPALVANLIGVLGSARDAVLRAGGLRGEEFDTAIARVREWGGRDDAAAWFSMCWAEGTRPR